jgi:hypothetical protein
VNASIIRRAASLLTNRVTASETVERWTDQLDKLFREIEDAAKPAG